ncbi:MAG: hypothetical protein R3E18_07055 [Sphingomonadaceae bacterium]
MTRIALKAVRTTLALAAFPLTLFLVPAAAQAPGLAMLDSLQSGEWELRFRDSATSRRICVRDGRELIQIRHNDSGCSRYVVEDGSSEVTVQYTCRGNGYGRTNIRRETARLVQIESQGIVDGLPFQFTAEGRRIGPCK